MPETIKGTNMADKKLTVNIEAESREGLIYWVEMLASKLREYPNMVSGRSSGGGVLDWHIADVE